MSFRLMDIPGEHFGQLSQFFRNGFESDKLIEQSQTINHRLVDGRSDEWYFDGIRMGYSDWHYKKPAELKWNYDIKVDMVTFQANLKGSVYIGKDATNS